VRWRSHVRSTDSVAMSTRFVSRLSAPVGLGTRLNRRLAVRYHHYLHHRYHSVLIVLLLVYLGLLSLICYARSTDLRFLSIALRHRRPSRQSRSRFRRQCVRGLTVSNSHVLSVSKSSRESINQSINKFLGWPK